MGDTDPREDFADRYRAGTLLYGDDLNEQEIASWFEAEESGYFNLAKTSFGIGSNKTEYEYGYEALNEFHAFSRLRSMGKTFDTCVALGCAAGDDVAPLAPIVGEFIGIEPAKAWWRTSIGGKPARYVMPSLTGDIPLEDGSADLITCMSVLHHIPNVSHVLAELTRILRPSGVIVLREPIHSMGDWRKPRQGLTAHERGLPLPWLMDRLHDNRLHVLQKRLCMFPPTSRLAKLGLKRPFNNKLAVIADYLVANALRWNYSYWREGVVAKLAPSAVFLVLQKS